MWKGKTAFSMLIRFKLHQHKVSFKNNFNDMTYDDRRYRIQRVILIKAINCLSWKWDYNKLHALFTTFSKTWHVDLI